MARIRPTAWMLGVLLLGSLASGETAAPTGQPADKAATGCSRQDTSSGGSMTPILGGCLPGPGGCYECITPNSSGYTICHESPDGAIQHCLDYQDI